MPPCSAACSFDILQSLGLQGTSADHAHRFGGAHMYNPLADIGGNTSNKNIVPEFYFPTVPSRVSESWVRKLNASISVAKSGPNKVRCCAEN